MFMIVKRKFMVTVFDDLIDQPLDYAFSNTYKGCLDYLNNVRGLFKKDLDIITFKIQIIYD